MNDFFILYTTDYWDGPLSGLCLFNNEKCYFDSLDDKYEVRHMSNDEWESWCVECVLNNIEIDYDDRNEIISYRPINVYKTPIEIINLLELIQNEKNEKGYFKSEKYIKNKEHLKNIKNEKVKWPILHTFNY